MKINSSVFKHLYQKKSFTQETLAEAMETKRSTINQWIVKESIPDKYIPALERIFGDEYLTFVVDEMHILQEPQSKYDNGRIPFYDIDVTAGVVDVFEDESTVHATASIHVPGLDADFAVPVHGNSMQPEISGGDWIAVKRINDLSWWNFGQKYLIVTAEQRLVKIIKRHEDDNLISLVSCNSDYDTIDMPKKKVKQLFMVVQVFKREVV
jgi:phage repressor protein C with HTH and peptisase S24 domain/DNA-binding XRE family transcriptional regulator